MTIADATYCRRHGAGLFGFKDFVANQVQLGKLSVEQGEFVDERLTDNGLVIGNGGNIDRNGCQLHFDIATQQLKLIIKLQIM